MTKMVTNANIASLDQGCLSSTVLKGRVTGGVSMLEAVAKSRLLCAQNSILQPNETK